jgi:hypothetical protein
MVFHIFECRYDLQEDCVDKQNVTLSLPKTLVKKAKRLAVEEELRHEVAREMEVGPPEPPCGGRLQTTHCCVS